MTISHSRQRLRGPLLLAFGFCVGLAAGLLIREFSSRAPSDNVSLDESGIAPEPNAASDVHGLSNGEITDTKSSQDSRRQALLAKVTSYASDQYKERCLAIIRGESLETFSQGYQDWLLFYNFFSNYTYGSGYYLDLGSNDPTFSSNTFFFDVCLGWKGICVEPNPKYHAQTRQERTCDLIPHCISKEPQEAFMNFGRDQEASLHVEGGQGLTKVTCVTLESILQGHNITRADFVSFDVEGQELPVIQCFPFDKYEVPIWTVETNKAGALLDHTFMRAGFAKVRNLLERRHSSVGSTLDSLYVRQDRPFVQGPAFLPGKEHHGKHFAGGCNADELTCMDMVPNVMQGEEKEGEVLGSCKQPENPLSW